MCDFILLYHQFQINTTVLLVYAEWHCTQCGRVVVRTVEPHRVCNRKPIKTKKPTPKVSKGGCCGK